MLDVFELAGKFKKSVIFLASLSYEHFSVFSFFNQRFIHDFISSLFVTKTSCLEVS